MLQPSVYLLCMIASLVCLFLLTRGYLRTGVRFLFWSALCFVGYAVNNLFLFLDVVLFPDVNLLIARNVATLFAITVLFYGLIWESD
ncbi:MAG: DUF5985 family protein [Rhodospirillaceae bacterium]